MDWQSIVVFSVVFWSTYHALNGVKDWRRSQDLARILRDMDKLSERIEKKVSQGKDDTIKRVK